MPLPTNRPLLQPWAYQLLQTSCESAANFADRTSIRVLAIDSECMTWYPLIMDDNLVSFLPENSLSSSAPSGSSTLDADYELTHTMIVFFISLKYDNTAQYEWCADVSQPGFLLMADRLGMHDAAVQNMLGRPDYWSAFGHQRQQQNDTHHRRDYEFFCQHPRTNTSRYVVSSSGDDANIRRLLSDLGVDPGSNGQGWRGLPLAAAANPFLVHSMMSSYTYEQSTEFLQDVRQRLFSQITAVNDYSHKIDRCRGNASNSSSRLQLGIITKNLHLVSQTCDTGIANAEMSIRLCEEMLRVYDEMCVCPPLASEATLEAWSQVLDSMKWVLRTWHCQKEWLTSYKARKDTAMNFVYNLVTQQDNALNIDMAQQATQYSSSMNAITILTMIFLPGTFIAGVFGSGIFDKESTHGSSDLMLPFIYACIPMTVLTLAIWYFRWCLRNMSAFVSNIGYKRRKDDLEDGVGLAEST